MIPGLPTAVRLTVAIGERRVAVGDAATQWLGGPVATSPRAPGGAESAPTTLSETSYLVPPHLPMQQVGRMRPPCRACDRAVLMTHDWNETALRRGTQQVAGGGVSPLRRHRRTAGRPIGSPGRNTAAVVGKDNHDRQLWRGHNRFQDPKITSGSPVSIRTVVPANKMNTDGPPRRPTTVHETCWLSYELASRVPAGGPVMARVSRLYELHHVHPSQPTLSSPPFPAPGTSPCPVSSVPRHRRSEGALSSGSRFPGLGPEVMTDFG